MTTKQATQVTPIVENTAKIRTLKECIDQQSVNSFLYLLLKDAKTVEELTFIKDMLTQSMPVVDQYINDAIDNAEKMKEIEAEKAKMIESLLTAGFSQEEATSLIEQRFAGKLGIAKVKKASTPIERVTCLYEGTEYQIPVHGNTTKANFAVLEKSGLSRDEFIKQYGVQETAE